MSGVSIAIQSSSCSVLLTERRFFVMASLEGKLFEHKTLASQSCKYFLTSFMTYLTDYCEMIDF